MTMAVYRVAMESCNSMPVQADRIKWKLAPTFDPVPFLSDPVVRAAFKNPEVLRRPKRQWPHRPKAVVHGERSEILKWDKLNACKVVACSTVAPMEAVGLFTVPKDDTWDRLILHPTVINSRSFGYSNFTKAIAPGYLIGQIQLGQDEQLLLSSDDLCEFYYTFEVSSARAKRNAIGVVFKGHELQHLSCFDSRLIHEDCYVCLGTLAMGDALAVEIAQSHINLLRSLAGCMLTTETLQYRVPCPRGPFYEMLTIDDHIGIQRVSSRHSLADQSTRDVEVFAKSEAAYSQVRLTAHPGKRQRQVSEAIVLGAEVHGVEGKVSAPRTRIAVLAYITAVIVYKGVATRKVLQALIGCWTHVCLFRRPVFAVMDQVYHEGSNLDGNIVFRLSKQAINELVLLCVLAPTMQTDLRASAVPSVFMMDASPFGGAICRAAFPQQAVSELWRHTEQRGFYTRLQQGPGMVLHELGLEHEELFGHSEDTTTAQMPFFLRS